MINILSLTDSREYLNQCFLEYIEAKTVAEHITVVNNSVPGGGNNYRRHEDKLIKLCIAEDRLATAVHNYIDEFRQAVEILEKRHLIQYNLKFCIKD